MHGFASLDQELREQASEQQHFCEEVLAVLAAQEIKVVDCHRLVVAEGELLG